MEDNRHINLMAQAAAEIIKDMSEQDQPEDVMTYWEEMLLAAQKYAEVGHPKHALMRTAGFLAGVDWVRSAQTIELK